MTTKEELIEKLTNRGYKHPAQKSIPISSVKKMIASLTATDERLSRECKHKDWFEYTNEKGFGVIHRCVNCGYTKAFEEVA